MSSRQPTMTSLGSNAYSAYSRSARDAPPGGFAEVASVDAGASMASAGSDALDFKVGGVTVHPASKTPQSPCAGSATANGIKYRHHGTGGGGDAIMANGSGNGLKGNTTAGGGAAAVTTTESVIEELKALAKSMLEATNAARRRTSSMEQRNSYEALMQAIESRVRSDAGSTSSMGSKDAAVATGGYAGAHTVTVDAPNYTDPNATNVFPQSEVHSAHLTEQLTDIPAALSPRNDVQESLQQLSPTQRDVPGKAAASTTADPAVRRKHRPAGSSQHQEQQRARPETMHQADLEEVHSDGEGAEGVAYQGDGDQVQSSAVLGWHAPTARDRLAAPMLDAEEDEEDDDGTVYDGVKTQVLFKPVNPSTYREVVASTWKPEALTRRLDATSDGRQQSQKSSICSSPSDCKGSPHPNAKTAAEDDDDDDGGEALASVANRNRTAKATALKASCVKVFRVPSFPYGGGVTEQQARLLQQQFDECIHNGEHLSSDATRPALVTKSDFDSRNYDEVSAATAQMDTTTFQPKSPYEFVVEVERDVRFDAVKAREERRHRFRQLVRENLAPATMGTFNLRVIMDPFKTGFEEEKNFPIVPGTVIAGRYEIIQMLGKATFSRAVRCYDLQDPIYDCEVEDDEGSASEEDGDSEYSASASPPDGSLDATQGGGGSKTSSPSRGSGATSTTNISKQQRKTVTTERTSRVKRKPKILGYGQVCLKIINNTKDFFDQSLDEIRLLTLLNRQKDPDEAHIIRLIDAFYYKEHIMLVTELLRDTLYDYGKYNREEEEEFYFTVPRLRRLTRQIVEALAYVHSLNLMHTDLKPENIMFVSYSRCIVKVIDFGSSCFLSDHLSSYIQSRSYRAPEVVLGCDYDGRIDVWSLGALLVEMVTGDVLFTSDTVPEMLARIVYVCGTPFPRQMLWEGRHTSDYINKFGCIYEYGGTADTLRDHPDKRDADDAEEPYCLYTPVPTMAPHTCRSRKVREAGAALPSPRTATRTTPYSVLREKLAAANMMDEEFIAFVEACLTLDHKKRPTSAQLLLHPFIRDVVL
ncbi:hypothetical protein JKF63_06752 [Porcisia hertigi]|uniref:Protein kinase domain-containing protein n=1 Tax=Porcisia hertigi TaxID=2761500 RepID=A0A836I138_9TRYP|nr:hypothetical protein JKF63_06752 [Porcisia hertigi]